MQIIILPFFYFLFSFRPVRKSRVVFADSHNNTMPFSMKYLHQELERSGNYEIINFLHCFNTKSVIKSLLISIKFMWIYASAGTVIICDYFLPVASCRKKQATTVVQLWHSGGLLKKFAYDAPDDIPPSYLGDVFANYDYITISAPACRPILARAMRMPEEKFLTTGISRTDVYFASAFLQSCRADFYKKYPQAQGKHIVLWAPTFRGNAANPFLCGEESILQLQAQLPEEYFLIYSLHPHLKHISIVQDCGIQTERLLPVTDLLITDYSSVLFDYLLFEKPFILFAPDWQEYSQRRGFYIDYTSLPGQVVTDGTQLLTAVCTAAQKFDSAAVSKARQYHMEYCDGKATNAILQFILNKQVSNHEKNYSKIS